MAQLVTGRAFERVRGRPATPIKRKDAPESSSQPPQRRLKPTELFPIESKELLAAVDEMRKFANTYTELHKSLSIVETSIESEKKREKAVADLKKTSEATQKTLLEKIDVAPELTGGLKLPYTQFFAQEMGRFERLLKESSERLQKLHAKRDKLAPVARRLADELPGPILDFPAGTCPVCLEDVLVKQPHVVLPCSHLLCWRDYAALPAVERDLPGGRSELVRSCPTCRAVIPRVDNSTWTQADMINDEPRSPVYHPDTPVHAPYSPSFSPRSPNYAPRSPPPPAPEPEVMPPRQAPNFAPLPDEVEPPQERASYSMFDPTYQPTDPSDVHIYSAGYAQSQ